VIRVLHVLGTLNLGGAETMIMNLYRSIDRSAIQFDFVIHTKEKCIFTDEIKSLGGKIYHCPNITQTNVIRYSLWWDSFFSEHTEYKIIHGHMTSTALIYLSIAKYKGRYTIAHSHSTSSGTGLAGIIKRITRLPLRYNTDHYFACSKDAGKYMFGNKVIHGRKFDIVKNPIQTEIFKFNTNIRNEYKKKLDIENKIVLTHIGRFHPSKNHKFLINVLSSLVNKNANFVLLLVGSGPLLTEIKEYVNHMNLSDNVKFLGLREDIPEILSATDLFLLPSLYEGLGNVAIEAQATGLPVFCSTNIPNEVNISGQVSFMPLEIETWVKSINEFYRSEFGDSKRELGINFVIKSGYDVKENAKWLSNYYINIRDEEKYGTKRL